MGRAHNLRRGLVHANLSCTAKVSLGENGGHRGVNTQLPAEQEHWRRHVVLQELRQTRRPAFLRATGTRPHGGRQAHLAKTSRHTRSPLHLQSTQQHRTYRLL